jgi:hypothetical protein
VGTGISRRMANITSEPQAEKEHSKVSPAGFPPLREAIFNRLLFCFDKGRKSGAYEVNRWLTWIYPRPIYGMRVLFLHNCNGKPENMSAILCSDKKKGRILCIRK